ncbi:hypothetical protein JCM10908_005629 [Rhodotorula pacifica]|uniref:L-rhamnose mutarotase n=1 Tax=Rhodotorula pacifica TaxID=1495444 RepID=UPI00317425C2
MASSPSSGGSSATSTTTSSSAQSTNNASSDTPAPVPRAPQQQRRFGSIIRLRPDCIAAYKACHASCWPEVQRQITQCKIHDYVIYHDPETGLLFSSFTYKGTDFERDMALMRANPKVREWWTMTDSYQESLVPGAKSSEAGNPSWWKPLEEVFYQA